MENFKQILRITILSSLLLAALSISGCYQEAKNLDKPDGPLKTTEYGFSYVTTCIDGNEFIATQVSYEYWTLAGPTGKCGS